MESIGMIDKIHLCFIRFFFCYVLIYVFLKISLILIIEFYIIVI